MKHFGEFAASLSLSKAQSESAKHYQFLGQKGRLGVSETSICSYRTYSITFPAFDGSGRRIVGLWFSTLPENWISGIEYDRICINMIVEYQWAWWGFP